MDPIKNPFSPGAGSPPPEMVGREGILEQARILLGRIKAKRPEKSILLTGLRGVGKTVLLNEIERMAAKAGYRTVSLEAHEDKSLAALLVPPLRKLLFELDRLAGVENKAKRALAVLKGFMSGLKVKMGDIEVGLDIAQDAAAPVAPRPARRRPAHPARSRRRIEILRRTPLQFPGHRGAF
ncbi:MAG: ATP-binding protein [Verrucomicrobiota bacterium]